MNKNLQFSKPKAWKSDIYFIKQSFDEKHFPDLLSQENDFKTGEKFH